MAKPKRLKMPRLDLKEIGRRIANFFITCGKGVRRAYSWLYAKLGPVMLIRIIATIVIILAAWALGASLVSFIVGMFLGILLFGTEMELEEIVEYEEE